MNAAQSKALIDAAHKAREALLALDPDSTIALELWTAIHRTSQKPAKLPARTKKIPKAQYGLHVWHDGRRNDLGLRYRSDWCGSVRKHGTHAEQLPVHR